MKKFLFVILSILTLALSASAQVEYRRTAFTQALNVGTTNSFVVDTRNTSGLALQVSFAGAGANTTTAIIGVTNSANAVFPQTLSVIVGGVTNLYAWTNAPTLFTTNLSGLATNLIIGITNTAPSTNGEVVNIVLNNRTNVFTFNTPAMALTDVSTNASATAGVATNFANSLSRTFTPRTVTVANNIVTLSTLSSDYQISENDSGGFLTNQLVGFYSITNILGTNSMQLQQTNAIGATATNLYNQLASDYAGVLAVTMPNTNQVQLVTILNPGLTTTATGTWSTNLITTNAISGFLNFQASNSLDTVTWTRQASRDFTVAYAGTTNVVFSTNYTDIFAAGWWAWSVGNSSTNYANANGIKILAAVKHGL